jgi:uncharacterized protein YjdB
MPSATLSLSNVAHMLSVLDLAPPTTKVSKINSTTMNIVAPDPETLMQFLDEFSKLEEVSYTIDQPFTSLGRRHMGHADLLAPNAGRSWFKPTELATIYNFPTPDLTKSVVVGVVSFGGGLYGSVSASGVVTGGDVQAYWSYLGISPSNMPRVIIKLIDGATNNPSDSATAENTLDVETIGAVFPSSNLTIILYIAPNSLAEFTNLFTQMLTVPVVVNGQNLLPNYISVSWGAPEIYFGNTLLNSVNTVLGTAVSSGINVSVASGDNGSSDGVGSSTSKYCDFPSSSPNVIACGGTNLVSPNYVYDGSTVETAWSSGGGAVSATFSKPTYQNALVSGARRSTPDIAMAADPATGIIYIVNGQSVVYGGTSVVAPLFTGFLMCAGANTFANPALYAAASSCFHDVTSGNNGGYTTGAGYDNCTGRGSINGVNLANAIAPPLSVTSVSLNVSTFPLTTGNTYQLVATVLPSGATNKAVSWSSSNGSVATVNSSGLVTGVASGTATITVTTADGNYTATATATVTVGVASVSLNVSTATLSIAQTVQLVATVLPSNASNKSVTWSTNNSGVATVNSSGLVTAVAGGVAVITVRTSDGSYTATTTVTVSGATAIIVRSITVNKTIINIPRNATFQLVPTILPANATNKAVTYSSSLPSIATVSSTGLIQGVKRGTSIITVTTVDQGRTVSARVNVI